MTYKHVPYVRRDNIDFEDIKNLFDLEEWDIAYVSPDYFEKGGHKPLKYSCHYKGSDFVTPLNGIILAKYTEETNNYSLYREANDILDAVYRHHYSPVYVNFKEVALLSGFAKRAKNSLVYNRKFGFQCKLYTYMFVPPIVNYEQLEPSTELLDLCEGCDDCIRNCPVGAIHEEWVDHKRCEDFMVCGNHSTIPSKKWFWYEKMNPNYTREEVESWHTYTSDTTPKFPQNEFWGKGVDGFYETNPLDLKKDGVVVEWPHCKECQKHPRCSNAPYLIN